MKIIITEEQSLELKYRRRIDELISHLKDTYSYKNPCEYYDVDVFLHSVKFDFMNSLVADWLSTEDEDALWDLITGEHGVDLREHYHYWCGI
jgi:hypothetical protein